MMSLPHSTCMSESPPQHDVPWVRHTLRVPGVDQTLLAHPSLPATLQDLQQNQSLLESADVDVQGRSLRQLRDWTRTKAVELACDYTSRLRGREIKPFEPRVVVAGGHQPALFHPGVWVKNFALSELAARCGGTALNLVVDNDTLSSTRIRVPAGDRGHPRIETIPFDDDRPAEPWEDAAIVNRDLFESFGRRVSESMAAWNVVPIIQDAWPDAVDVARGTGSLRDSLTALRVRSI